MYCSTALIVIDMFYILWVTTPFWIRRRKINMNMKLISKQVTDLTEHASDLTDYLNMLGSGTDNDLLITVLQM